MSTICARIGYGNQLHLANEDAAAQRTYSAGPHTFTLTPFGVHISTEVPLTHEEQQELAQCLTKAGDLTMAHISHWDALTPTAHAPALRIANQVWDAARMIDRCIRQTFKGIRLEPLQLVPRFLSQSQSFPVVDWNLTSEERNRLSSIYSTHPEEVRRKYNQSIAIPLPISFDRRQVFLDDSELDHIGDLLTQPDMVQPYRELHAIAWERIRERAFAPAILILATAVETALKSWLIQHSDGIGGHLLQKMQSPPVEELLSVAIDKTGLSLPAIYKTWLVDLRKARNDVAHKPQPSINMNPLEVVRWFAISEAMFNAMQGVHSDTWVGCLVEPIGGKATEHFQADTRGVVLRREELYGENSLHVLLDTGQTYRFGPGSCKQCTEQRIK